MNLNKKFRKYSFKSGWDNDMMIAFLSQLSFDSFEEKEDGVIGYLPENKIDDLLEDALEEICSKYKITFEIEEIENKNWNKEWESSFEPVAINDFCLIKADFHQDIDTSNYKYTIDITPEMTFGTGHHETTYLMIELMSKIVMEDKKVLDFGAGTGILSILAEKMGADSILAIDIDPIAVDNIEKNARRNNCTKITAKEGDKAIVDKFYFNIVLANINRNVLEEEAKRLSLALKKGGFLVLSGILVEDKQRVISLYENNSMKLMKSIDKGKWSALKFVAY